MTMLKVAHLQKIFNNRNEAFVAVDNISFTLDSGSILALLGPNGAGKTTTLQMIAGYLFPTSGEIWINDKLLSNRFKDRQKQIKDINIGVVFGGELGFYGRATAYDNLFFFSNLMKIKRKLIKAEIHHVLEVTELLDVSDKKVEEFSRGMRQRLHIARALLGKPNILLLDEPTNGLDVEIAHNIRKLIKELANQGVAILITSHSMSEIESIADRIILLGGGKIFHDGTVESVVNLSKITHIDRPATLEESYLSLSSQLRRK